MIKGVLLDLDNTLLRNPDRAFAQAFKARIEAHFVARFGMEGAASGFRRGIAHASSGADGRLTVAEMMLRCLADSLGLPVDAVSPALDDYYAGTYMALRELTAPVEGADTLVEMLLGNNLLVAIATNPIYPQRAILQRLAWAGLAHHVDSFAFITHSQNVRFAKPDRAYYAELAARVGVEPDECLVIGDSQRNDIAPAAALGMHTILVTPETGLQPALHKLSQSGWQHEFLSSPVSPDTLVPQFMGNLAALAGLLAEVKAHQWRQRPDPGEWSIIQILCHLWQAETAVHQQRLRSILDERNPFIPALPPPGPHIPECHEDGFEVYERFRQQRRVTMRMLDGLNAADWARPARHSIFGLTNLLEMAHFTAQHDRLHITQLCQTLGKCAD